MAYGSQKITDRGLMMACLALSVVGALWGESFELAVRHERLLKDRPGQLVIDGQGVRYQQVMTPKQLAKPAKADKKPRLAAASWDYQDIQQFWLSPKKIMIVTYQDRPWLLGADKEFEFYLTGKQPPVDAVYQFLKAKLDERFVAALADDGVTAQWRIPAKLLGTIRGSQGELIVGADDVVYRTSRKNESRTWRLGDIENISTAGPFELSLTSYERAKMQYGGLKTFNFQLKQKLDPARYEALWRRLNRDKGLQFLTSIEQGAPPLK